MFKVKIVPYLKQQAQPHFFNSLTIALLPIRKESIEGFSETGWHPPELHNEENFSQGAVRRFGPMSCGYWSPWSQPAEGQRASWAIVLEHERGLRRRN